MMPWASCSAAHGAGQPLRQRGEARARAPRIERDAAADQGRGDAPEHQIGVGDGRLAAAVRIAHRSGLGAGAARPDLEVAFAADPGDRAAAGADGLDVDHRDAHRERADRAAIGDVRPAAFDQAEVGRGAAGVERHHVGEAGDLGHHGAAERAGRRARQRGGDRLPHDLLGAGDAAARLHHQERLVLEAGAELVVHAAQIAFHVRLDEGVDQSGDRALVFAIFGQHRAGERQRAVGIVLRENLRDAPLVRGIGIGVDQADADRAHALPRKNCAAARTLASSSGRSSCAAEIEPAAHLAHEMQRHDALRLHPEIGIAVALRHRLAGDLQDMPEACGDDQPEPADLALQQRVGGDRGAVGEAGDVVGRAAGRLEDRLDAAHQPDRRIGGRARHLGDPHGARAAIDRNDIGEGAAGVDADPQTRLPGR